MAIARYQRYDNFTIAMVAALGIHAVVLLGLAFVLEIDLAELPEKALDVVLVNWRSEEAPEEADFLAQANQQGGGESESVTRPSSEQSSLIPELGEPGDAPVAMEESIPEESERQQEVLTRDTNDQPPEVQVTEVEQDAPPTVTADQLLAQSMQMARLQPELSRDPVSEARYPRRKFISSNTREYEYASYMQAWVAKVERIGNLNYPQEVRQRRLFGDLLMTVGILRDGSIESIVVKRSSGLPELDEAAQHIVRLSAPFAPLPEHIAEDVDVLHITRTWRFSNNRVQ